MHDSNENGFPVLQYAAIKLNSLENRYLKIKKYCLMLDSCGLIKLYLITMSSCRNKGRNLKQQGLRKLTSLLSSKLGKRSDFVRTTGSKYYSSIIIPSQLPNFVT